MPKKKPAPTTSGPSASRILFVVDQDGRTYMVSAANLGSPIPDPNGDVRNAFKDYFEEVNLESKYKHLRVRGAAFVDEEEGAIRALETNKKKRFSE